MDEFAGVVTVTTGSVLNVGACVVDHGDAPVPSEPPVVAEPHVRTRTVRTVFAAYVFAATVADDTVAVTFPVDE